MRCTTGESFSEAKRQSFDLAVVGGGIIGTWVAYLALSQHPGLRVVLIDRSSIGSGATRDSVGLSLPVGATPEHRQLSVESEAAYHVLFKELRHVRRVLLPVCWMTRRAFHSKLQAYAPQLALQALEAPARADLERAPLSLRLGQSSCYESAPAWFATPKEIVQGMATSLQERGCVILEQHEVKDFVPAIDGYQLELGKRRSLRSHWVVIASGPWLTPFHGLLDVPELRTKKIVTFRLEQPVTSEMPAIVFCDDEAFWLPVVSRGQGLLSITSQHWDCEPKRESLAITPDDLEEARRILSLYLPHLGSAICGAQVFCDGYTPSRLPLVRGLDTPMRCVLATGGSGSGFRFAPAIAQRALKQLEGFLPLTFTEALDAR